MIFTVRPINAKQDFLVTRKSPLTLFCEKQYSYCAFSAMRTYRCACGRYKYLLELLILLYLIDCHFNEFFIHWRVCDKDTVELNVASVFELGGDILRYDLIHIASEFSSYAHSAVMHLNTRL